MGDGSVSCHIAGGGPSALAFAFYERLLLWFHRLGGEFFGSRFSVFSVQRFTRGGRAHGFSFFYPSPLIP